METTNDLATEAVVNVPGMSRGSIGAVITRVTLGVITLLTWRGNIADDFYDGDNFAGFFDWVSSSPESEGGGNGASLGFVHSIIDSTILQAPELFGWFMTIFELSLALALILGVFTRAASLAAVGFFGSLFLVYYGGEEWIGTYVLLTSAAVAIFADWGGRKFGLDQFIAKARGESPGTLLW